MSSRQEAFPISAPSRSITDVESISDVQEIISPERVRRNKPMSTNEPATTFEQVTEIDAEEPTLIEGLPGFGLVASIAVDQVTKQLGLEHHGNVLSNAFPSASTFHDGRVRDLVRVYAGSEPAVMTLQSEIALPQNTFEPLSECVLSDLAQEFGQAIFLVGAPAENEGQIGAVRGVATTDEMELSLREADIQLAGEPGLIGGVTGALLNKCYHRDVPAAALIVKARPALPDPTAAKAVIEDALEPLVDFDIDTAELEEQANEIRQQLQQIADQYQQMNQEQQPQPPGVSGMYQ